LARADALGWPPSFLAAFVLQLLFERPRELRLAVQLAAGASASTLVNSLERLGVRIHSFELGDGDVLDLLIDLPLGVGPDVIVRRLATQQNVRSASWRT
jgi:hypothetical protein